MKNKYFSWAQGRIMLFCMLIVLVLICYGQIWKRGGYADDFAFLSYSTSQSYPEAVANWPQKFNSRMSQGLTMPLILKAAAGETPDEFNWWIIHAIGISAFVITIYIFYQLMGVFGLNSRVKMLACLLFALHPVKNQTILWSATIVGYVLPLLAFLMAAYIYFASARGEKDSMVAAISVFILSLYAAFSIEIMVPLLVLMVAIRLWSYRIPVGRALAHVALLASILLIFVGGTIAGNTAEKVGSYQIPDISAIPAKVIQVISHSMLEFLGYPFRILLDGYFWPDIRVILMSPLFWFGIVAVITLLVSHERSAINSDDDRTRTNYRALWASLAAVLVWLVSLSPFMVIDYGLPDRALYIPLLGFSLATAVVVDWGTNAIHRRWATILFISVLAVLFSAYIAVNIYSQTEHKNKWQMEKKIISTIQQDAVKMTEGTEISLFNLPKWFGPTPTFVDYFTFNGMVKWIAPEKGLSGYTLNDFSDVFDIPEVLGDGGSRSLQPKDGHRIYIWKHGRLRHVTSMKIHPPSSLARQAKTTDQSGSDIMQTAHSINIEAFIISSNTHATYNGNISISIPRILLDTHLDFAILQVLIEGEDLGDNRYRLNVHAVRKDGDIIPYDMNVHTRKGFIKTPTGYAREVFIDDISGIGELRLSLSERRGSRLVLKQQTTSNDRNTIAGRISFF